MACYRPLLVCFVFGLFFAAAESSLSRTTFEITELRSSSIDPNPTGCSCQGYGCGCCLLLDIKSISLNQTACVNITYLPEEVGVRIELSLNGRDIIDRKISVKNPPPVCADIPYVHKLAALCVLFYDLDLKNKQLSGCVAIQAELAGVVVEDLKLGCFKIPPGYKTNGWINGPALKGKDAIE